MTDSEDVRRVYSVESAIGAPDEMERLREALADLRDWCSAPYDDHTEKFDHWAEIFRRETGLMRPGKSVPLAMGGQDEEERHARYRKWVEQRATALFRRVDAALMGERP